MKSIDLGRGAFSLVDDKDFLWLSWWKWSLISSTGYARRGSGKGNTFYMHRAITGAKAGEYVDHINGDKLDNRKENLRICTNSQNNCNKPKNKNNTSGFKGVFRVKHNKSKPFMAQIVINRKSRFLGYFSHALDAAIAYDEAAKIYHKEFARFNV